MSEKIVEMSDRISEMLSGTTVLITGGSGFLGQVLIEKILRRCNGVKVIYLLLRSKKEKTYQERLNDIFNNALFSLLRSENPDAFHKCIPIEGDVSFTHLGISSENRKTLQEEVEFIFHSAATTRFDDPIETALRINTRGTKFVLDLAHECKKLKIFVHVSTAFAFPNEKRLEEKPYPASCDPLEVLKTLESSLNDDYGQSELSRFLGSYPNSYSFSKALAEDLVVQIMNQIPAIIVRPAIVCPTWLEPLPGWCSNLQGAMGLLVGAGKGVIRTMYGQRHYRADFVPADVVINSLLTISWNYLNFDKTQRVYNVTPASKLNITWKEIIDLGTYVTTHVVPFNMVLWCPGGSITSCRPYHNLRFYLFQLLPAIFIDAILRILKYEPVLVRIQRRIQKGYEMLEYYVARQWEFDYDKVPEIKKRLNQKEKQIYRVDSEGFDKLDYVCQSVLEIRRNNFKETDSMLPAARRNIKILWALDRMCKFLFVITCLYYFYKWILFPLLTRI